MNASGTKNERTRRTAVNRPGIPDRKFVRELFQGLAPRYNRLLLGYSLGQDLRWKHVLVRRLHAKEGELALDLACGTGLILDRLSRVLGASMTVGADINRPMLLEMAREGPFRPLVQADAERLPLVSKTFDIVTAGYLLKYVQLDRFFSEVARVLRPGGRFGGYDFSRPTHGTPAGRLYSIYLHRILPSLSGAVNRPQEGLRTLFEFLPHIAESSDWVSRLPGSLERAGFVGSEVVPSLGGAVTWVWARKRM
jgi:demethylmenaquinone methyltransferase/2-methoxy-6-polyprenyl-1,4-benzoquinol methylase